MSTPISLRNCFSFQPDIFQSMRNLPVSHVMRGRLYVKRNGAQR